MQIPQNMQENNIMFKLPQRHKFMIALIDQLYNDINGLNVLDVACGHNFPVVSWFEDNNSGPILPGYLASQGANVTGLDEWHFKNSKYFPESKFTKKAGMAERVGEYFPKESFDLVISCAYFGYPSSRKGTRPDYRAEYSTMEQLHSLTKEGGYGIHLLMDGYWQLEKKDLLSIGYDVKCYLGDKLNIGSSELDRIVLVQKN